MQYTGRPWTIDQQEVGDVQCVGELQKRLQSVVFSSHYREAVSIQT